MARLGGGHASAVSRRAPGSGACGWYEVPRAEAGGRAAARGKAPGSRLWRLRACGHLGRIAPIALGLLACATAPAADVSGRYRHEGPIAAGLEVRRDGNEYVVRLEGGGSAGTGAASAADCIIEARGVLDGNILDARFGPVETDTFSYGAAQAASEARSVEIAFEPGAALVRAADTFGYCGLDAVLTGRYRKHP